MGEPGMNEHEVSHSLHDVVSKGVSGDVDIVFAQPRED